MQILTNDPNKLIVRNRSRGLALVFLLGGLLWLVSGAGLAIWAMWAVSQPSPLPSFYLLRLFGLVVLFALAAFSAWAMLMTGYQLLAGITFTFDRSAAQLAIDRPYRLHLIHEERAIYSVSHALIERRDEARVLVLYLVLRSGERISMGVCSPYDLPHAESIVSSVRGFLHSV